MSGYVIAAVVCSIGCAVGAFCFLRAYREGNYGRAFWLKGLAAVFFVAVGAANMLEHGSSKYAMTVLCGLLFGLCGDQLLALRLVYKRLHDVFFIVGALSFGVGHVLYILAQRMIGGFRVWIILPVFLVGAAISLLYAKKRETDVKEKTPMAIGYIALVLFMACGAISVAVTSGSAAGILFAVGGVLFVISDNILCAYCYGKDPVWSMNRDLHIAYYGAQLAIAWSIFFV